MKNLPDSAAVLVEGSAGMAEGSIGVVVEGCVGVTTDLVVGGMEGVAYGAVKRRKMFKNHAYTN